MTPPKPSRGEIWFLNLDPAQGHEQSGSRPALVVSVDPFNHGPADMVWFYQPHPKPKVSHFMCRSLRKEVSGS